MADADESQRIYSRFDEFQSEAVNNIVSDFRDNPAGRYLLVIPTGGGKTHTAAKAINRLFHDGLLDSAIDTVVWAAHREELIGQANKTFASLGRREPGRSYIGQVRIMMIGRVHEYIRENTNVRLLVIDEAHHSAVANVQYGPLFEYTNLGMLGLTATPSRHDGQPLEFEKESYSIGFPDLVERQIILAPEVRSVRGGHYGSIGSRGATGFHNLSVLNDSTRDARIIEHLQNNSEDYRKVIIYVGSVAHAEALHQRLRASHVRELYDSVDCITGSGWSGAGATREEFFERIRNYRRSIVINVDVLTEGYDDPTVNTVVMARPTRSKLVYMQAIGRCIRVDPNDVSKRAFIVEVEDELPNIRYRIDNRWLFSEISDVLEPQVVDCAYTCEQEFDERLAAIYEQYNVDRAERHMPQWDSRTRYSLLLFRVYVGQCEQGTRKYRHIPILVDGATRATVSNWFNFLSERMQRYVSFGLNYEEAMIGARYQPIQALSSTRARKLVFEAMEEASRATAGSPSPDGQSLPWITFISFRHTKRALSVEVMQFLVGMVNRDAVERDLLGRHHTTPAWLIKLPLPLAQYVGLFLDASEFEALQRAVDALEAIRQDVGTSDHRTQVREFLSNLVLSIPESSIQLLPAIIRDELPYFIKLN
jgi:superfamily II DNA or RNA helicase